MTEKKKGDILLGVYYILIILGVYVHHLFFLIPTILILLMLSVGYLQKKLEKDDKLPTDK